MSAASKKEKDLHFAYDVGHSSIGWAVLRVNDGNAPEILGTGAVVFQSDDCLASERRTFRRQRRHIRATRLRIERLKRLLEHVGVLTREQLDGPGCAWPWLLAASVLAGGERLTWTELWDVLRWYAHNRGYDGNAGWSREGVALDELGIAELNKLAEDDSIPEAAKDDAKYLKGAKSLMASLGTKTMAETWCAVCGLDPSGTKRSCNLEGQPRPRALHAAFPRRVVENEVERILSRQGVADNVITAIMRDHTAVSGPRYAIPGRFGQQVKGRRVPGGLLFGQLIPRFDNRIIATCPVEFQRGYATASEVGIEPRGAAKIAAKRAKVPSADCAEFYRFRWAMQLANVVVACDPGLGTRRLSADERKAVHEMMEKRGALTPGEFKEAVRARTGTDRDNLDRLLALPDADKSLILDPARKLVGSGVLAAIWPHVSESSRKHKLTELRRGKGVTVRELVGQDPAALTAFERWFDGEALRKSKSKKGKKALVVRTKAEVLNEVHTVPKVSGRAPHSREVMKDVLSFVLSTDRHPADGADSETDNGPLFRNREIRAAQLNREVDEQTNNHLVRHRLKILERLNADLVAEYAAGDFNRIERITIEVNRALKELSGKPATKQSELQRQQTEQFRSVEKKLAAAYDGLGVRLGAGLIRKARVAEDLGWKCPYTGLEYDPLSLLHGGVDKDHIIPRTLRSSDSLDSLVITLPEINRWKGDRTALQFVEEEGGKHVPGKPELMIKTRTNFLAAIDGLETRGAHDDDHRRKSNRQRLLKLREYVEKEFTPGDLTRTSQLVRLAAEALQRAYQKCQSKPVVISIPGSVTAAIRKSWKVAGTLATANPAVLNTDDLDENGRPRVHRKTELRGITHLHHALDAGVIALSSALLPMDGGTWKKQAIELLAKRRCTPSEQAVLRTLLRGHISFSKDGHPLVEDLPGQIVEQLRLRLAERRVVQHVPAEMRGLPTKQTVWRIYDPNDPHPSARRLGRWLTAKNVAVPAVDESAVLIIRRKRRGAADEDGVGNVFREGKVWRWIYEPVEKSKLIGFDGAAKGKLRAIKGGKLIADNFGLALFPDAPKGLPKFAVIRFFKVWEAIKQLRAANGGKRPLILRRSQLVSFQNGRWAGKVWRICGLEENGRVKFYAPDSVRRIRKPENFEKAQIGSMLRDGLTILKPRYCGVPSVPG